MFGQLVTGLPNSGKSTFCYKIGEHLKLLGRNIKFINLDPGCDELPYKCDIDIRDIVCLEEIMEQESLGPNEALVFAMQFLLINLTWLVDKLAELPRDSYIIFDMPGQVELYIHHEMVPKIVQHLTNPKGLDFRLVSVFLVDSIFCHSAESYISTLFATLPSMLHMALPQINIISKSSKIRRNRLPARLSDLTKVSGLEVMVEQIKDRRNGQYKEMFRRMVDTIVDLPWLSFSLYDFQKEKTIVNVVSQIDVANGYHHKELLEKPTKESNPVNVEDDKAGNEFVSNFL